MFYNSKDFKVLEAGVKLSWTGQQLHLQNIANLETPGYKAKSLEFQAILDSERQGGQVRPDRILGRVVSDENLSVRQDGNNVDLEIESVEIYKTYTQYALLLDKIKGQFNNYSYVLGCNMK